VGPENVAPVELGLRSRGQALGPHAKRPQCMGVLLRLHAGQQSHDVSGVRQSVTGQPLGGQAAPQHVSPYAG
jgi:hypothetical protein